MKHGKAKVSWDVVCLPKNEGGLGIKRLRDWNISLMTKHIWNLLTRKDSLWVNWIYLHQIRDRHFWDISLRGNMSWTWRKIIQIRDALRQYFWFRIGDGTSISVWFDIWDSVCPLFRFLRHKVINREAHINNKIVDMVVGSSWNWPPSWLDRFPSLSQLPDPMLRNHPDRLCWRTLDGSLVDFKTSVVWDTIRSRSALVDWYSVVWYPMCIPRHAIHLWLVLKEKLKTQDRLKQWDVGSSTDLNLLRCSLCNAQMDSHSHLFFECSFSSQVWLDVLLFAGYTLQSVLLPNCVSWIKPIAARKTARSVIFKLLLGSTTYVLWQERNLRLFQKQRRSEKQVVSSILEAVRFKLFSFKFKPTDSAKRAMEIWKLPRSLVKED